MKELFGLYFAVALPVTLACIGHLAGCKRKMHALDVLFISAVIGILWVLIPFWFKGES